MEEGIHDAPAQLYELATKLEKAQLDAARAELEEI